MPVGEVDDVLKFPRRARQPIDVPADHRVDLTGRDVSKQPLPFGSAFAAKRTDVVVDVDLDHFPALRLA